MFLRTRSTLAITSIAQLDNPAILVCACPTTRSQIRRVQSVSQRARLTKCALSVFAFPPPKYLRETPRLVNPHAAQTTSADGTIAIPKWTPPAPALAPLSFRSAAVASVSISANQIGVSLIAPQLHAARSDFAYPWKTRLANSRALAFSAIANSEPVFLPYRHASPRVSLGRPAGKTAPKACAFLRTVRVMGDATTPPRCACGSSVSSALCANNWKIGSLMDSPTPDSI